MREVDGVEIIVLVDNVVDLGSTVSRPEVKRAWWFNPESDAPEAMPWAEHGFAALVRVRAAGRQHTLLFDAGTSGAVALHNAACFGFPWEEVDAIALSHGHHDHCGGVALVLAHTGGRRVPLIAHEDMFVQRGNREDDGRTKAAPVPLSADGLRAAGADLIFNTEPHTLFDGALLVLGEVPRQTDFEDGVPTQIRREGENWLPDPWTWDDRSVVVSVRGEGLVVVTGCAHAGIINTLLHARQAGGSERLRAVIGGFHLFGSHYEPHIGRVARELQTLKPALLVPLHCTGPRGSMALVQGLPAATVTGSVLMRIRIGEWE